MISIKDNLISLICLSRLVPTVHRRHGCLCTFPLFDKNVHSGHRPITHGKTRMLSCCVDCARDDLLEHMGGHGGRLRLDWSSTEIPSSVIAESFLKASYLLRYRYGHRVTLLPRSMLCEIPNDQESTKVWLGNTQSPILMYWAHRQCNFHLYVEVLEELALLFSHWTMWTMKGGCLIALVTWWHYQPPARKCLRIGLIGSFLRQLTHLSRIRNIRTKLWQVQVCVVGLTVNPTAFWRWMLSRVRRYM